MVLESRFRRAARVGVEMLRAGLLARLKKTSLYVGLILLALLLTVGCDPARITSSPAERGYGDLEEQLDCGSKTGLERDQCVSFLANEKLNDTMCYEIENAFVRDVCHRDVIFSNELDLKSRASGDVYFPFPVSDQDCFLIADPHLQYQCLRLYHRPRTMTFLSERPLPSEEASGGIVGDCSAFDRYHASLCMSLKAARLAGTGLEEAQSICTHMGSDREVGECEFLVTSALVTHLEANLTRQIDSVMELCNNIPDHTWRWGCSYMLADELAVMRPVPPLEDIARVVSESSSSEYYNYLDSLLPLLPGNRREEFCTLLSGVPRSMCSQSLGRVVIEELGSNATQGDERCSALHSDFRKDCRFAVARQSGRTILEPFSLNVEQCDEFKDEARQICFIWLGFEVSFRFLFGGWNLSYAQGMCEEFQSDVKGHCYYYLGWALDVVYVDDPPPSSVEACEGFPAEFRQSCFEGLGRHISVRSVSNISTGVKRCQGFPVEFQQICLDELSLISAESSLDDIALATAQCNEFPELSRPVCFAILTEEIHEKSHYDAPYAIEKCTQLPAEFKDDCFDSLQIE